MNFHHYMDSLKNVNEKRVWDMIGEYTEDYDTSGICLCWICITDIAAITLNNIPPCYQTEENLDAAREKITDAEIFRQLKRAIKMVSERPHH